MEQLKGLSFKVGLFFVMAVFWAQPVLLRSAWAAEAVCPSGISPDANVLLCDDFEDGTWKDTWSYSPGNDPIEKGEAVRCDGNTFGFNDRCAAYSGVLGFDNSWGYGNHYGETHFPDKKEYRELYARLYVFFSDPYVWGNVSDKGIYFRSAQTPSTDPKPYVDYLAKIKIEYSAWGRGGPNLHSYALDGGERRYQNMGNDLKWKVGTWYRVEFYSKLNDPGVANGIAKLWVDEAVALGQPQRQTLRLFYDNLLIQGYPSDPSPKAQDPTVGYTNFFLSDYHQRCDIGTTKSPEGNDGDPNTVCPETVNQWVKWDNIVVSTSKIDGTPPAAPKNLTVK